jgi:hypothetical protein
MSYTDQTSSTMWCQLLPKLRNNHGQQKFLAPFLPTASSRFADNRTGSEGGFAPRDLAI